MNIVFDQVLKAFSARREADGERAAEVRVAIAVARDCDAAEARALRAGLFPQTAGARVYVAAFGAGGTVPPVNGLSDAAVVLAGAGADEAALRYEAYRARGIPCCVVVGAGDGKATVSELVARGVAASDAVACDARRGAGATDALGSWLVAALPDLAGSLAAGFPCCRRARALAVAGEAVRNNALVGALTFLDGADMPVMLATEVAMMLKMASAYGLDLGKERLTEGLALTASAFVLRGASRVALGRIPLPAPVLKAGIAALGTYAVSRGLMVYYESLVGGRGPVAAAQPVEPLSVAPVADEAGAGGLC